jgi:hypothetical protein
MFKQFVLAAQVALTPSVALAQDLLGTVTILDGSAFVYRGSTRVHAAPGVRLESADIIESGSKTFLQIELPDRTVVQIGPGTRVILNANAAGPKRTIYAIEGWIKLSAVKRDTASGSGFELRTPLLDIPAHQAALVIKVAASDVTVFAETGAAKVIERQATELPAEISLKQSDLYLRKAGEKGTVNRRAKSGFFAEVPAAFKDSLPVRIGQFHDKAITLKAALDFSYEDVEPWLKSEAAMRALFVERWREKASEPNFRSALIANLSAHPEWDAVLFPEKHVPKRALSPRIARSGQ